MHPCYRNHDICLKPICGNFSLIISLCRKQENSDSALICAFSPWWNFYHQMTEINLLGMFAMQWWIQETGVKRRIPPPPFLKINHVQKFQNFYSKKNWVLCQ